MLIVVVVVVVVVLIDRSPQLIVLVFSLLIAVDISAEA